MIVKPDQALSNGELEHRLRHTFGVVVPLIERTGCRPSDGAARAARGRTRRAPVAVACSVIVALGVAGGIAMVARDGAGTTAPDAGSLATPIASVEPAASAVPAPGGRTDRADQVTWFLPTVLPEGYELTALKAELRVDGTPNPDIAGGFEVVGGSVLPERPTQTWRRRGADGLTNEDTISIEAVVDGPASPPPTIAVMSPGSMPIVDGATAGDATSASGRLILAPNTTVGGVDAVIVGPPVRESPGWTVNWAEEGIVFTLRATDGVSEDEALALAETATVEGGIVSLDPAALPDGFEPVPPEPAAPQTVDRIEVVTFVVGAEGRTIQVRVNTPVLMSLDEIAIDETERREIDGVEYSLFESSTSRFVRVAWSDGERVFVAESDAPLDDVLAVASSTRAVTFAEAEAASAAITASTLALPVVATATLGDGTSVSVHGPADDIGVVGICVDTADGDSTDVAGAEGRCIRPDRFIGQPAPTGLAINAVFHLEGDRRTIAWSGIRPELTETGLGAPELVAAATGVGWFVDQVTPAGEPLRSIGFRSDDGSLTGIYPDDSIRP